LFIPLNISDDNELLCEDIYLRMRASLSGCSICVIYEVSAYKRFGMHLYMHIVKLTLNTIQLLYYIYFYRGCLMPRKKVVVYIYYLQCSGYINRIASS
jgi:hypothetical protein